jgi:flagellar hook-associated protein 2
VEIASDAALKYEGVAIERPSNSIDDIVPGVTLTLRGETAQSANIKIEPDTQAAKDALITFVGNYNQAVAELNILSQNKPEIVGELGYLSSTEQEAAVKRLGMFFGDYSLAGAKTALAGIVSDSYLLAANSAISLLAQIGISTRADSSGGITASRLRGYLEIDEKKLDQALANNLPEIKNLLGYDSDGDFIIDSGIAYLMSQRLDTYTRRDGIFAARASGLDSKIVSSETKILRLESQLDSKEAQLKQKYGQMEAALNSLESQSTRLDNFSRQNQGQR